MTATASAYDVLWTCIIAGGGLSALLFLAVADDVRRKVQAWRRRRERR